jgi:hypothetical protein
MENDDEEGIDVCREWIELVGMLIIIRWVDSEEIDYVFVNA